MQTSWHPNWWSDEVHGIEWSRVREALRRDWEQTKKDLHVGGHELNQSIGDTTRQVAGEEALPPLDRANPPKVIGQWDEIEFPLAYGYSARAKYGAKHPAWNDGLEVSLRSDWETGRDQTRREWNDVKRWVRHGYEYTPNH